MGEASESYSHELVYELYPFFAALIDLITPVAVSFGPISIGPLIVWGTRVDISM